MELKSDIISLSKIRDGLFIGDKRAGTNLDLLMQFKISHIINATGIPLPYSFESLGIKYIPDSLYTITFLCTLASLPDESFALYVI